MDPQPSSRGRSHDESLARALGRTIKVLRTDRGLGRKDLARRAGLSYSYLTEIENGTKPASNSILGPIAETLGLPLHELIARAEARLLVGETPLDGHGSSAVSPSGRWSPQPAGSFTSDTTSYDRREEALRNSVAPPSARRSFSLRSWSADSTADRSPRPDATGSPLTREVLGELEELLPSLTPEDQLRLLDMARRLAR